MRWAPVKPYAILFLRLVLVFVFAWHGAGKAFAPQAAMGAFQSMGFPGFLGPIIGWIELFAALLILIGVWHRWANLAVAGIMLVSTLFVHLPNGVTAGFERDLTLLASALLLAVIGPGRFATIRDGVDDEAVLLEHHEEDRAAHAAQLEAASARTDELIEELEKQPPIKKPAETVFTEPAAEPAKAATPKKAKKARKAKKAKKRK